MHLVTKEPKVKLELEDALGCLETMARPDYKVLEDPKGFPVNQVRFGFYTFLSVLNFFWFNVRFLNEH